jgi:hypothetical protein
MGLLLATIGYGVDDLTAHDGDDNPKKARKVSTCTLNAHRMHAMQLYMH